MTDRQPATMGEAIRAFERQVLAPFINDVPQPRELSTSPDKSKHQLEGRRVTCDVQLSNGARTRVEGKLLLVRRELCYVETGVGICKGETGTLEEA